MYVLWKAPVLKRSQEALPEQEALLGQRALPGKLVHPGQGALLS